ncbi:MAG: response regulator [Myxococcota bacterium]
MARDPYRYFRIEAQELVDGLARGLLELDKPGVEPRARVKELLRHAHTLKGAARVVKVTAVGDLAHQLEDVLAPLRERDDAPERPLIDGALALVDAMRERLATLGTAAEAAPAPPAPATTAHATTAPASTSAVAPATAATTAPPDEGPASVRVGVSELDVLVEGIAEAVAAAAALRREVAALSAAADGARALLEGRGPRGEARVDAVRGELERAARDAGDRSAALGRLLGEARELAADLRLVPASVLLDELQRATRDAARASDKPVAFHGQGADLRVDAAVVAGVRGALRHVVRNAVAHGIEDAATRARAGKPPTGSVTVSVARAGYRLLITCRDDGRGLDLEALRRAALERGLIEPAAAHALDRRALVELALRGGLSTAGGVSDLAGRGVGLDAVREATQALKGEVDVLSEPGVGTTVELRVPLSLAALQALSVEAGGRVALIPLDSVRRTVRMADAELARSPDGERLIVDGVGVPFVPLADLLGHGGAGSRREASRAPRAAVIVEAGGRLAAFGVERLAGAEPVVLKHIPAALGADPVVVGAALDEDGVPRLVLAPGPAVAAAHAARRARPAEVEQRPILVVDDSLTTRMLEQSILVSAGYAVEVAASAEEALVKVRARRFAVMVVDVEMPGMSGFELLELMQKDPELARLPSILVTSRADPEDRRRGLAAGAGAYIVKSDFDQRLLLDAIRRLALAPAAARPAPASTPATTPASPAGVGP